MKSKLEKLKEQVKIEEKKQSKNIIPNFKKAIEKYWDGGFIIEHSHSTIYDLIIPLNDKVQIKGLLSTEIGNRPFSLQIEYCGEGSEQDIYDFLKQGMDHES